MRVQVPLAPREEGRRRDPGKAILRNSPACWVLTGLLLVLADSTARAQYPPAHIPDLNERSGLLMRFAGTKGTASSRSPARQFLQHPICRPGTDQASRRNQGPRTLRPGLEGRMHRECLSLLLREPGHNQGERVLSPLASLFPVLAGRHSPLPSGRNVLLHGELCADLRSRPDRSGARPLPLPLLLQLVQGGLIPAEPPVSASSPAPEASPVTTEQVLLG